MSPFSPRSPWAGWSPERLNGSPSRHAHPAYLDASLADSPLSPFFPRVSPAQERFLRPYHRGRLFLAHRRDLVDQGDLEDLSHPVRPVVRDDYLICIA